MFISRHKFRSDTSVLSQHPLPFASIFSYQNGGVMRRSAVKLLFCNNDSNLQKQMALASKAMRDVQVQLKVLLISKVAGRTWSRGNLLDHYKDGLIIRFFNVFKSEVAFNPVTFLVLALMVFCLFLIVFVSFRVCDCCVLAFSWQLVDHLEHLNLAYSLTACRLHSTWKEWLHWKILKLTQHWESHSVAFPDNKHRKKLVVLGGRPFFFADLLPTSILSNPEYRGGSRMTRVNGKFLMKISQENTHEKQYIATVCKL